MGKLLSLLSSSNSTSTTSTTTTQLYIDFSNSTPVDKERDLVTRIESQVLSKSQNILSTIKQYKGCGDEIRRAISSPSKETEREAWAAVEPKVIQLKEYYDYSLELSEAFTSLLSFLTASGNILSCMEECQVSCRLLAEILVFALVFDDYKMTNPSIQNDFSYYRRTTQRRGSSQDGNSGSGSGLIKDELANRMSLFYAYPTPMMRMLVESIQQQSATTLKVFKVMVDLTHLAVKEGVKKEWAMKVLVASIVLYDNASERGAFAEMDVGREIKLIRGDGSGSGEGSEEKERLLNALRYNTKHLNEASKGVKSMLGVS